jgi:hypothetical protein
MIKILMSAVALTALTTSALAMDMPQPYWGGSNNQQVQPSQPMFAPRGSQGVVPNATPVIPMPPQNQTGLVYLAPPPPPVVVCWYNCR